MLDACERLVGVTDIDDYPGDVADVDHVVIGAVVDVELVVAAEPDLILAAGNELTPSAVITGLADLGYPVIVLYPETLHEVTHNIELVGQAINAVAESDAVVADMESRIEAVEEAVAGEPTPRTFYEVGCSRAPSTPRARTRSWPACMSTAGADPHPRRPADHRRSRSRT